MRRRFLLTLGFASVVTAAAFVACSSASDVVIPGADASAFNGSDAPSNNGDGANNGSDANNLGDGNPANVDATSGEAGACDPNPANAEIPDNGCDDDDDGKVDDVPTCDTNLDAGGGGGSDFANAIGICDVASTRGFGLISVAFTKGYGAVDPPEDQQHELLASFGNTIVPREGVLLAALSSGYAFASDDAVNGGTPFQPGQDWYGFGQADLGTPGNGTAPPGYPKAAKNCPQETIVNDMVDVKLTLKAPPNAKGFSFDSDFWTADWPTYVCTRYNDAFVAYLTAQGFNEGKADNIAFDPAGNPIAINASFFNRCTPNTPVRCDPDPDDAGPTFTAACSAGEGELYGTGFYDPQVYCENQPDGGGDGGDAGIDQSGGGATGWLSTVAPVNPGETFTLEFMIWDAADASLDSSVLLDHFHWLDVTPTAATTRAK